MSLSNLPRYQCHKSVSAVKIAEVRIVTNSQGTFIYLVPDGPELDTLQVSPEYMSKHRPTPGGWYIRYDDGYESFSPAAAFESGYTRIPPPIAIVPTGDMPLA